MKLTPDIGMDLSSADLHDLSHPFYFDSGAAFTEPLIRVLPAKYLYLTRSGQFIMIDPARENSSIEMVELQWPVAEVVKGLLATIEAGVQSRKNRLNNLRATMVTFRRAVLACC